MTRKIELLVFIAILLTVALGVIAVDTFANIVEQKTELAGNTEQVEQAEQVAEPFENPHESELIEDALDWHYVDDCLLTAYCPCEICCGEWAQNRPNGIVYTASGAEAQPDHTIAVDPSVIPLGAWVEIDGNTYHAEDTGNFTGNHIDIYFSDHEKACEFGCKKLNVRWYE